MLWSNINPNKPLTLVLKSLHPQIPSTGRDDHPLALELKRPSASVPRNRGGKFNLHPPLHSPFTSSSPLATKMQPTRLLKVTTPARKKPNQGTTRSIPPQKERPISLRDYPWLNSGRQTSSSSSRWRKDAKASSPRIKVPPVFSPQWAQQARAASQSARFVSSPQDRH
jgi:hypothetical protein